MNAGLQDSSTCMEPLKLIVKSKMIENIFYVFIFPDGNYIDHTVNCKVKLKNFISKIN